MCLTVLVVSDGWAYAMHVLEDVSRQVNRSRCEWPPNLKVYVELEKAYAKGLVKDHVAKLPSQTTEAVLVLLIDVRCTIARQMSDIVYSEMRDTFGSGVVVGLAVVETRRHGVLIGGKFRRGAKSTSHPASEALRSKSRMASEVD